MFQVTEKASEKIQEFFKDKEEQPIIRIFLAQGG
ncbi:MAG: adhesin [Proteobacteria bacterium]|nr:adhesin [Pseudomonadota bacterium]